VRETADFWSERVEYVKTRCPHCGAAMKVPSGRWLRKRRLAAGLTLRALGKRAGLTAAYLCDVELGRRRVTERLLGVYERIGRE